MRRKGLIYSISVALIMLLGGVTDFLHAAGTLHGKVQDAENRTPIDHVSLVIVELQRHTETDNDGAFHFDGVPEGRYTLRWVRIGYLSGSITTDVAAERVNGGVELLLVPLPVASAGVTITAEREHKFLAEKNNPTVKLEGKDLQQSMGQTLALTLQHEAGLSVRSMGPAPARPVVRGLGGDRVQISEDGEKTSDLSASAPDHAVTVDPFMAEKIEIIRGPRILLRTPVTIGGVIDVVRNEIPERRFETVSGNAGLSREAVGSATQGGATVNIPAGPLLLRGEAARRYASDIRTPVGTLGNTFSSMLSYAGSATWVGAHEFGGVALREFHLDYGIPGGFVGAHPRGVTIDIFKRQITAKGTWYPASPLFEALDLSATRTYYHHTEFEASGLVGSEFTTFTHTARADLRHGPLGPSAGGTWGLSFESRSFEPGGFVFTPKSLTHSLALYALEQGTAGPIDLECAARIYIDRIKPERDNPWARIGHIRTRSFAGYAFSVSLSGKITEDLSAGAVVSRSSRVPTIEELFSEGPHLAAYSFEVGNPDLSEEHGFGVEGFLTYATEELHVRISPFLYALPSYIITSPTGDINFTTLLPVYASSGVPARLTGVEIETIWHPVEEITLSLTMSHTTGVNTTAGSPLPTIPPLHATVDARYSVSTFTIGSAFEASAAQNRVASFEMATAGYGVLSAFVQWIYPTDFLTHAVNLTASNLFDAEFRNHLSRAKSILPEPGRNVRLMYRLYF